MSPARRGSLGFIVTLARDNPAPGAHLHAGDTRQSIIEWLHGPLEGRTA